MRMKRCNANQRIFKLFYDCIIITIVIIVLITYYPIGEDDNDV